MQLNASLYTSHTLPLSLNAVKLIVQIDVGAFDSSHGVSRCLMKQSSHCSTERMSTNFWNFYAVLVSLCRVCSFVGQFNSLRNLENIMYLQIAKTYIYRDKDVSTL